MSALQTARDSRPTHSRHRAAIGLIACALLIGFPLLDPNPYHVDVATAAAVAAVLALGLNVIVGFAGLLNLGYAAFFAIGAYTYALVNLHGHCPFWLGVPLAAINAAIAGLLLGLPVLRVRGDYLAIVTLGFGEIVRLAFTNLDRWTGGPNGLLGIEHPIIPWVQWNGGLHVSWLNFGVASTPYYYVGIGLLALVVWVCARLARSRIGRAWAAIREDELAAHCAGIDVIWMKLAALGCGAAIAGIAGSFYAAKQGTITPDSFDFILSVMILAMVVLGGLGSVAGAVLGAVILTVVPELLRGFALYRMLLFGGVMILIMRLRPQGLLGSRRISRELRTRRG